LDFGHGVAMRREAEPVPVEVAAQNTDDPIADIIAAEMGTIAQSVPAGARKISTVTLKPSGPVSNLGRPAAATAPVRLSALRPAPSQAAPPPTNSPKVSPIPIGAPRMPPSAPIMLKPVGRSGSAQGDRFAVAPGLGLGAR